MAYPLELFNLQHYNLSSYYINFYSKTSKKFDDQCFTYKAYKFQTITGPERKVCSSLHLCFCTKPTQSNLIHPTKETPFALTMLPLHRSKIVHLVRHGQGYHNIANTLDKANYTNWDYEDACLTEMGWQQAEALREHVINLHLYTQVELVVISPLRRTLQTAVGAWGGGPLLYGETQNSALMLNGVECNKSKLSFAKHGPISSAGAPPFIVNEWCREQNGNHPCDKRKSISFLKTKFPAINFSLVESDEDTWWNPERRETTKEVFTRARIFLYWLLEQPETRIAVVSHSSFLYHMCHLFGDDLSIVMRRELQQGFKNVEMRSMVIADRQAGQYCNIRNTNFVGGLNFKDSMDKHNFKDRNQIDISIKQINVEDKDIPQADDMETVSQDHN